LRYLIDKRKKFLPLLQHQASHEVYILSFFSSSTEPRFVVQWNMDQFFIWKPAAPDFIKLQRLQYKVIRKAIGYRISILMPCSLKPRNLNIRFNFIASKFIYKAMANKFSIVYSSLEEIEITAIRKKPSNRSHKGF